MWTLINNKEEWDRYRSNSIEGVYTAARKEPENYPCLATAIYTCYDDKGMEFYCNFFFVYKEDALKLIKEDN